MLTIVPKIQYVIKGHPDLISDFWIQRPDISSQLCSHNRDMIRVVENFASHCVLGVKLLSATFRSIESNCRKLAIHLSCGFRERECVIGCFPNFFYMLAAA